MNESVTEYQAQASRLKPEYIKLYFTLLRTEIGQYLAIILRKSKNTSKCIKHGQTYIFIDTECTLYWFFSVAFSKNFFLTVLSFFSLLPQNRTFNICILCAKAAWLSILYIALKITYLFLASILPIIVPAVPKSCIFLAFLEAAYLSPWL